MLGGICSNLTNSYRPRTRRESRLATRSALMVGDGDTARRWPPRVEKLASFRRVSGEFPLCSVELPSSTPPRVVRNRCLLATRWFVGVTQGYEQIRQTWRRDCRRVDRSESLTIVKVSNDEPRLHRSPISPLLVRGQLVIDRRAKESSAEERDKIPFLIDTRRNRTLHSSGRRDVALRFEAAPTLIERKILTTVPPRR
jgi:hypothetical protein